VRQVEHHFLDRSEINALFCGDRAFVETFCTSAELIADCDILFAAKKAAKNYPTRYTTRGKHGFEETGLVGRDKVEEGYTPKSPRYRSNQQEKDDSFAIAQLATNLL
jgi:hypothetical protein